MTGKPNKFPPCPNCKRKGLHYASHPHAQGWKDYERVVCRFCGKRYVYRVIDVEEA